MVLRVLFACGVMAALPVGAVANANSSSNWAGYAIHRSGVSFSRVSAVWTQPNVICHAGTKTYSAYWVGLGGYNPRSGALEQVGTELDCDASGQVRSSAWYELVPAASRTIRFRVRPGEEIRATVTVSGHRVVVELRNETTGHRYRRVLHATRVDVSSADWIVEAPSGCASDTDCQTLPLADFGSASFGSTHAKPAAGHVGSIRDRRWRRSKISLVPGGQRFVAAGAADTVGEAIPSALNPRGTGFGVTYSTVSVAGPFGRARLASPVAGRLVHPGR